ncbi:5179_t:CDS:1 [Dentiscutata erythropus]|uniref:5179_t:CDS:1 n=1 Tax=Dentiscutata erythropus TaxID=1348616 RepID=A0A9N9J5P5_9GLOM|nr:5179_t:CDS:1 [Dentiscutata erythropus]
MHGDGANFVSQVVEYAGGSQQNDDWSCKLDPSPYGSYPNTYGIYKCTLNWINVVELTSYLTSKNIARKCNLNEVQKGDLIMYTSQNGKGHQSVVVIGPDPENPQIAYHSRDQSFCNGQPCDNCSGFHSLFIESKYTFHALCMN